MKRFFFFTLICFLGSCLPVSEEVANTLDVNVANETSRYMYDLQNEQKIDSLLFFLENGNASQRYLAARAFGSIQDKSSTELLEGLLQDPNQEIAAQAAFSLGQIAQASSESPLIQGFIRQDTVNSVNNNLNSGILEAVGKLGSPQSLKNLSTISSYQAEDYKLLLGQARGIYHFGLRGITSEEGTKTMVRILTDLQLDYEVRLVAANYLARMSDINIDESKFQISQILKTDAAPEIRMACATALKKTNHPQVLGAIIDQLESENDYRVKCNMIRSLGSYNYADVIETITTLLKDENIHVASLAADYLNNNGKPKDATLYRDLARDEDLPWLVRSKIYQAALTHVPFRFEITKGILNKEITDLYSASTDPYKKAAYLRALSGEPSNYRIINDLASNTDHPVLKTALIDAFQNIISSPKWPFLYATTGRRRYAKGLIAENMKSIIMGGDAGQIAAAANVLSDPKNEFNTLILNYDYLDSMLTTLNLPAEAESYNAVVGASNFLLNNDQKIAPPAVTHQVEWSNMEGITDTTIATIVTNKGQIEIQLMPSLAPATVSNFIDLVSDNFFDNKVFHRVVPNFVIQTGCTRGDGYGSLPYSIRSEFGPSSYNKEGMVGMARDVNALHTESSQFFITHSPTMHLDHKFTLFAQVISGMDIVHKIEVGDMIQDILIDNI